MKTANKKFNVRKVMTRAHELRRENGLTMGEALKRAWAEEKADVEAAGNRLPQLRAMLARIQAEIEATEEILKAGCKASPDGKIYGNGWKASLTTYTKNQLDTKSLKAEHADIYAAYAKTKSVTRFDFSLI